VRTDFDEGLQEGSARSDERSSATHGDEHDEDTNPKQV
jgi:hypothetical protein